MQRPDPLFVVGFPRSGTTLLQSLICTQPGLTSFPETHFFLLLQQITKGEKLREADVLALLAGVEEKMEFRLSDAFKAGYAVAKQTALADVRALFEGVVTDYATQKALPALDTNYRWVEKTPYHAHHLSYLATLYPEARFIGIVREPVSAIASFYENLVNYRQPYISLARSWRGTLRTMEKFAYHHPDRMYLLRYEDLATQPDQVLGAAFGHFKWPFEGKLLANFKDQAAQYILPSETWKNNNVKPLQTAKQGHIPLRQLLRIQRFLATDIARYKYDIKNNNIQKIYNVGLKIYHSYKKLT